MTKTGIRPRALATPPNFQLAFAVSRVVFSNFLLYLCLMKRPFYNYEHTEIEGMNAYQFISKGTQGEITKIVAFEDIGNQLYNLVLLDYDTQTGILDDEKVSNNQDIAKIMATIFRIVSDFTDKSPENSLYIRANTETKRMLYNRIVSNNMHDIAQQYEVFWRSC